MPLPLPPVRASRQNAPAIVDRRTFFLALGAVALATRANSLLAAAAAAPAASPAAGQPWKLPLASGATLDLAWIKPGTFTMGSAAGEPGRREDEGPQTQVTLSKGYWIGKYFVTIGDWKAVMGVDVRGQLVRRIKDDTLHDLGGKQQPVRDFMRWSPTADPATYLANEDADLPVYFVSWDDAMEFCRVLNDRERAAGRLPAGYAYSLPTEAQWEYACRAGTKTTTYAGTNDAATLDRLGWYDQNSASGYTGRGLGRTRSGPRAVGKKEPNAWGLYDMYGNIWQWCYDRFGPYPGGSVTDPMGPASGTGRVNRGGSFGSNADAMRSARRASNPQPEASAYRGFRLALAPVISR